MPRKRSDPWYRRYPGKFLEACEDGDLTFAEQGLYNHVLDRIYEADGPVPYNDRVLAAAGRVKPCHVRAMVARLVDGGYLYLIEGKRGLLLSNPAADLEISRRRGSDTAAEMGDATGDTTRPRPVPIRADASQTGSQPSQTGRHLYAIGPDLSKGVKTEGKNLNEINARKVQTGPSRARIDRDRDKIRLNNNSQVIDESVVVRLADRPKAPPDPAVALNRLVFELADRIYGESPSDLVPPPRGVTEAQQMLDSGLTAEAIAEVIRAGMVADRDRGGPRKAIWYFRRSVAEASAKIRRDGNPGGGVQDRQRATWLQRLKWFGQDGTWGDFWGPPPGDPYCIVPADIRREFPALFQPDQEASA